MQKSVRHLAWIHPPAMHVSCTRRGGGAPFLFYMNISSPSVAEVVPGSPVLAQSGDADAGDVPFDCLPLCFPCVLQIGGPRGEKGQKGEPAIIEPVRTLCGVLVVFSFFPKGKGTRGMFGMAWCSQWYSWEENFPWKNYLVCLKTFNIKYCNYVFKLQEVT